MPVTSLVEVFDALIQDDWKLSRTGAFWLIQEVNKTANPLLKISGASSIGFTLDKSGAKPWPFLKPLEGMLKVCDAIIITQIKDRNYVLAIEMKSGNTTKAGKQIHSAWIFTEWLRGLLKLHSHWGGDWYFCGIVSSTPRKQARKGTSRHEPALQVFRDPKKYPLVHLRNQQKLNLIDLDNALVAA
jgi:hypothetical protein